MPPKKPTQDETDEAMRDSIRDDCWTIARLRNVTPMEVLRGHREMCRENVEVAAGTPDQHVFERRIEACNVVEIEGF